MAKNKKFHKQYVSNPNNWLYYDSPLMIWWGNDGFVTLMWRDFFKQAIVPAGTPDFPECTDEEKIQWELDHPIPVGDEPEPENP